MKDFISIESIENILYQHRDDLKVSPDTSLEELSTEVFNSLNFNLFDTVSSFAETLDEKGDFLVKELVCQLNNLHLFEQPLRYERNRPDPEPSS
jgi:hypothetical protein